MIINAAKIRIAGVSSCTVGVGEGVGVADRFGEGVAVCVIVGFCVG